MTIAELVKRMENNYEGFHPAASKEDLAKLEKLIGKLPPELVALYSSHDGSSNPPGNDEGFLAARLMPIAEVLETAEEMKSNKIPQLGSIIWLWNDDAGNLLGLYLDGPFQGWLAKYDHEESILIPSYRSIGSFIKQMLDNANYPDEDSRACDLIMLERDVPAIHMDDPLFTSADRKLRELCLQKAEQSSEENVRLLYVMTALVLTPTSDNSSLKDFLAADNDWIQESAIKLMDMREFYDDLDVVISTAKNGDGKAVAAATRFLVRSENEKCQLAVEELKQSLKGENLQWLNQWLNGKASLRTPRWE